MKVSVVVVVVVVVWLCDSLCSEFSCEDGWMRMEGWMKWLKIRRKSRIDEEETRNEKKKKKKKKKRRRRKKMSK